MHEFSGDDILPGQILEERLLRCAAESKLVLWLVSPESIGSAWVSFEVAPRFAKQLPLIPILAPGQKAALVPEPYRRLLCGGSETRNDLNKMITAVTSGLGIQRQAPESYEEQLEAVLRVTEDTRAPAVACGPNSQPTAAPGLLRGAPRTLRWTALGIVAIYLLNGLAAPICIRGQTLQVKAKGTGKEAVSLEKVWVNGIPTTSNQDGYWTVPIQTGGLPKKVRVAIRVPGTQENVETSFWVLWPAIAFFSPYEDIYELSLWEQGDARLTRRAVVSPPRNSVWAAWAQEIPKTTATSPSSAKKQPGGAVLGKGFAARYEFGFQLRKVKYGEIKSVLFFRSNRAYVTVRIGPKVLSAAELSLPAGDNMGGRRPRFPIQSNPESWLPATPWQKENVAEDLFCRLTPFFSPVLGDKGLQWLIDKTVLLTLVGNRGDTLGRFDLTGTLKHESSTAVIRDEDKGGAEVQIDTFHSVATEYKQFLRSPYRLDWIPEKLTLAPGQKIQVRIRLTAPAPLDMDVRLSLKKGDLSHPASIRVEKGQRDSQPVEITAGKTAGQAAILAQLPEMVGGDHGDINVNIR